MIRKCWWKVTESWFLAMSMSRGGKFPAGNQEEDFSSDESLSSKNSSLYSKSDSEISSPRVQLSSNTTRSSTSSSASLTDNSGNPVVQDAKVSRRFSDSNSNSDCDNKETSCRRSQSPIKHSLCLATDTDATSYWKQAQPPQEPTRTVNCDNFETKTSSGLIIRPPVTKSVTKSKNFWWPQVRRGKENGVLFKMYTLSVKYHREICIVLFMLATGLPFLRSKPLKTKSVQTPGPFFDQQDYGNLVEDYYQGEYIDLVQNKIPQAPSFVLYYAPWDSECLAAKSVFLDVARHFKRTKGGQVKFYAVNCWWPDGQCRQNYKNLSHYPIFVAHINGAAGIIYNGPVRAELMIRFLNLVIRPVTRIDTEDELWRFRAQHDAVMLAFFNFSIPESATSYDIYLQMALRNLEGDPLGQVGFGVFLRRQLAEKYFVTSSNAISLVLFNEIHTAKWHGGFPSQDMRAPIKQVADWVMERTKTTPITWAYRVRNGFSNRPVTLGPIDLAQELSNGPVLLLITRRYYPAAYSPFYAQVKEVALDYFNCNKSGNVTRLRRYAHKINSEWLKLWKSIQKICYTSTNTTLSCEIMMEQLTHWKTNEVSLSREPLMEYENISTALNFTGSSCRASRPFRFIAIDPADVPHFIELALGGISQAAESLTDQEPLAFIIDGQKNLMIPLVSFKTSDLAKAIHSYSLYDESTSGGLAGSDKVIVVDEIAHPTKLWVEKLDKSSKTATIKKLNAEDFLSIVDTTESDAKQDDSPPLFVMYTAKFCGYCGVALAQFVSLTRLLGDYELNITFARIDVFRNSLPSHLTVGDVPSFLFFPSTNRSDVRIFPPGEEITTKNLLKFLLSELDAKTRIEMSMKSPLCMQAVDEDAIQSNKMSGENLTRVRWSGLPDALGPENCQLVNKRLVTEQISTVLEVLKTDVRDCCSVSCKELKARQNYLLGLNKYKPGYFNGDKLRFIKELSPSCTKSRDISSDSDNQCSCRSIVSAKKLTDRSLLNSEMVATWSNQLLDHLRSMRLLLDVK
ncbi:unnamed protein product [Allacma fusca]|uniref:Thioredoxin domain-containing protein n=1 Tax=Allacma fusca TaxID=39272 RepID=A0A8J2PAC4_9HEXA|nr:unnamed protein product [Allacma fusca]